MKLLQHWKKREYVRTNQVKTGLGSYENEKTACCYAGSTAYSVWIRGKPDTFAPHYILQFLSKKHYLYKNQYLPVKGGVAWLAVMYSYIYGKVHIRLYCHCQSRLMDWSIHQWIHHWSAPAELPNSQRSGMGLIYWWKYEQSAHYGTGGTTASYRSQIAHSVLPPGSEVWLMGGIICP